MEEVNATPRFPCILASFISTMLAERSEYLAHRLVMFLPICRLSKKGAMMYSMSMSALFTSSKTRVHEHILAYLTLATAVLHGPARVAPLQFGITVRRLTAMETGRPVLGLPRREKRRDSVFGSIFQTDLLLLDSSGLRGTTFHFSSQVI